MTASANDINNRIKQYRKVFVPSHYTPFGIQSPKQQLQRQWSTITAKGRYLDDATLAQHLAGDLWVAPQLKTFTNTIVIDIDVGPNFKKRTAEVCAAFPEAAPLMVSTPRGGIHQHYVLSTPNWSTAAEQFAHDRLTDAGVDLDAGKVEVFPAGAKIIRAPLGRDCYLLDEDGVPVHSNREVNLWHLDDLLTNANYDTLTIPLNYGANQTPTGNDRTKAKRRVRANSSNPFMQEVDKLLSVGLTGPSQRNDALLKLNWYMHIIWGFDGPRVERELTAWIDDKHNGHSVDFNADRGRVYRQIRHVVAGFDEAKVGTRSKVKPERHLEREEIASNDRQVLRQGIEAHLDQCGLDGRTRRFYGKLLDFANRRGNRRTLNGQIEIEIPSRTLKTFDRKYGEILPRLLASGIVSKSRNFGVEIGRSNTFVVESVEILVRQSVTADRQGGVPHCS
jgi:hypothetical protein